MKFRFLCTLALVAGTLAAVHAQTAPATNPFTTEAQQAWNRTWHNVVAAAAAMPEDKYGYKPTPESMSFRELIAHVADSAMGSCSSLGGPRHDAGAAKMTTKAELAAALTAAGAECEKAYAPDDSTMGKAIGAGPMGGRSRLTTLWANTVHIEHEYAMLGVHLRINGVVPPSTAERPARSAAPPAAK